MSAAELPPRKPMRAVPMACPPTTLDWLDIVEAFITYNLQHCGSQSELDEYLKERRKTIRKLAKEAEVIVYG